MMNIAGNLQVKDLEGLDSSVFVGPLAGSVKLLPLGVTRSRGRYYATLYKNLQPLQLDYNMFHATWPVIPIQQQFPPFS